MGIRVKSIHPITLGNPWIIRYSLRWDQDAIKNKKNIIAIFKSYKLSEIVVWK